MRTLKAIIIMISILLLVGCQKDEIDNDIILEQAKTQFNMIIDEMNDNDTVTCDRYFVRNATDCNQAFINYLRLYHNIFDGEIMLSLDEGAIYIEQPGQDDKTFQFIFEYEMIDSEIYFTSVLFQHMRNHPDITIEDIATFYATMALDERDNSSILCDAYFAQDRQIDCLENRDYLRLFDDKFESVSLFRIDAYTYIYNIALKTDYRIVYQYYITMDSIGDTMKIDRILTYNRSVINEPNELRIYINEFMRGVTPSNVRNICFQDNKIDTSCIEIMNLIDTQSVIYDYDITDVGLVFKLILAGEKKLTMFFTVRNVLSEDYTLTLYFDMVDYSIESNFLSPKDLESKLNTIYALDYGRVSQSTLCDRYIDPEQSKLVSSCKKEQDFFQSEDGLYEVKHVQYVEEFTYLVEAFNIDNTLKEAYEITVTYNDIVQDWLITSYQKEDDNMMSKEIPTVLLEAAFYEFKKINPYDYCAFQVKDNDLITENCLINFYNTRALGFHYELISVQNAPKDNTFYVKYNKINAHKTYVVESIVTVLMADLKYYYNEDIQVSYEVDPVNANELERLTRRLDLYTSLYFDQTVTSGALYASTINKRYDETAYIDVRNLNLTLFKAITIDGIDVIITDRYITTYRITYSLTHISDAVTVHSVIVPKMSNDTDIAPLFKDIPYQVPLAEMKIFFDDYVDALNYESIGNYTCADFFDLTANPQCTDLEVYTGDEILSYEVEAHQNNIFRVELRRRNETETYTESYLYTVTLIDGEVKIVEVLTYGVIT